MVRKVKNQLPFSPSDTLLDKTVNRNLIGFITCLEHDLHVMGDCEQQRNYLKLIDGMLVEKCEDESPDCLETERNHQSLVCCKHIIYRYYFS